MSLAHNINLADDRRGDLRKQTYAGETLKVILTVGKTKVEGYVINITVGGLGIAVGDFLEKNVVGTNVVVALKPGGHEELSLKGVIVNLGSMEGNFGSKTRVGIALTTEAKKNVLADHRKVSRVTCPLFFRPSAYFEHPFFANELIFLQVIDLSIHGLLCVTSARNHSILEGLRVSLNISLPAVTNFQTEGRVVSVRKDGEDQIEVRFVVDLSAPASSAALAEYFMLVSADVSARTLKAEGYQIQRIARGFSFQFLSCAEDLKEIAILRLNSSGQEDRNEQNWRSALDAFDDHSRHIIVRSNGKIIAATRIVFCEGEPNRCEHHSYGAKIGEQYWKEGFVETSRLVIHPDFRGGDLFLRMLQFVVQTVMQSGYSHMIASCEDSLLPVYQKGGMRKVGAFRCADSPVIWNLMVMNVRDIVWSKGMDPLTWNIMVRPITEFLLRREVVLLDKWKKWRLSFYRLFEPVARRIANRQRIGRVGKAPNKIEKK